MTPLNKIEFRDVFINDINKNINILTYSKANFSTYFSIQSVAQCINELLNKFGSSQIFREEFFQVWNDMKLQCMTEFQIKLLLPANMIMDISTEVFNPMPNAITNIQYLNDKYHDIILNNSNIETHSYDIFCVAENKKFITEKYVHEFMHSIGLLSFISILHTQYIRILYKVLLNLEVINNDDIEYIYETLTSNRKNIKESNVANVFQLDADKITFTSPNFNDDIKINYVDNFNKACRIFKLFAFQLMDAQAQYISKTLQIVVQFSFDTDEIKKLFENMQKLVIKDDNGKEKKEEIICRASSNFDKLSILELNILHSIIKIHLMIQRMTNTRIQKHDLDFYTQLLKSRFSMDLNELMFDANKCNAEDRDDELSMSTLSFESVNGNYYLLKNYTIGEIISEFIQLYSYAWKHKSTVWICKFINMACNPHYSNLVNIMADFVPLFQRFFTNDFNINTINNLILFLQGMCRPDETKIKSLKNPRDIRNLDIKNFKTFSITKYQAYNTNPLETFMNLILTSKQNQEQNCIINLNTLSETERHNLTSLIDPNEHEFIDYIYELLESEKNNGTELDLSGNKKYNLQDINYDNIVPIVSANTFNENNTTCESVKLFNGINNQTILFHELTNRIIYKVPNIVCNIVTK